MSQPLENSVGQGGAENPIELHPSNFNAFQTLAWANSCRYLRETALDLHMFSKFVKFTTESVGQWIFADQLLRHDGVRAGFSPVLESANVGPGSVALWREKNADETFSYSLRILMNKAEVFRAPVDKQVIVHAVLFDTSLLGAVLMNDPISREEVTKRLLPAVLVAVIEDKDLLNFIADVEAPLGTLRQSKKWL